MLSFNTEQFVRTSLSVCPSQETVTRVHVCVDGDGAGTCTCNPGYTGQFCDELVGYCLNVTAVEMDSVRIQ